MPWPGGGPNHTQRRLDAKPCALPVIQLADGNTCWPLIAQEGKAKGKKKPKLERQAADVK